MTTQQDHIQRVQFLKDYETYLSDHHFAADTISVLRPDQLRAVLLSLWQHAPHNTAKALATECPISEDGMDEVEGLVQDMLWDQQSDARAAAQVRSSLSE